MAGVLVYFNSSMLRKINPVWWLLLALSPAIVGVTILSVACVATGGGDGCGDSALLALYFMPLTPVGIVLFAIAAYSRRRESAISGIRQKDTLLVRVVRDLSILLLIPLGLYSLVFLFGLITSFFAR